jgi:acyl-CoA thioesterase-1
MLWSRFLDFSFHNAVRAAMVGSLFFGCGFQPAKAAAITIVALGTSNTYGAGGLARNQTYPAQLQALLKTKGIDARVINAGVNGDTSARMLARLNSAVPSDTRLVLIEVHPNNEIRGGVSGQTSENVAAIKSRLQARSINYIDISSTMTSYVMAPRSLMKMPDRRHLNGEGYARVVESVLPQVLSGLGK